MPGSACLLSEWAGLRSGCLGDSGRPVEGSGGGGGDKEVPGVCLKLYRRRHGGLRQPPTPRPPGEYQYPTPASSLRCAARWAAFAEGGGGTMDVFAGLSTFLAGGGGGGAEEQKLCELTFLDQQEILLAHKRFSELLPKEDRDQAFTTRIPKSKILMLPELRANPFRHRICHVFSTTDDREGGLSFEDFLDMLSVFSDSATPEIKSHYAFRIFGEFQPGWGLVCDRESGNTLLGDFL
uniref:uncharacterized protein LOC114590318 n=1 Tax=Podarcis muralis TaxID=64176 RepID=UPI00109EED17|nr:uncharacterized protein LOC114590318 [Podarcis muralis]